MAAARPAQHGALGVIRWVVLGYACLEGKHSILPVHRSHSLTLPHSFAVPFSCYYRYLAWRAQARRESPRYSRQFLRTLLKRSLENGLEEDKLNQELEQFSHDRPPSVPEEAAPSSPAQRKLFEKGLRKRGWLGGEGAATPEALTADEEPSYPPTAVSTPPSKGDLDSPSPAVFSGAASSASSSDTTLDSAGDAKRYQPSFISVALEANDPRALDFRNYIRVWFTTTWGRNARFEDIHRLDMADWIAWSLYGVFLEELEAEREVWEKAGRPDLHLEGDLDPDAEGLEIEGDKLGLVNHVSTCATAYLISLKRNR